jgi:hypothetical protein
MDKVADFYAQWFAKKRGPEYSAAEVESEGLANDLLGVHESNSQTRRSEKHGGGENEIRGSRGSLVELIFRIGDGISH